MFLSKFTVYKELTVRAGGRCGERGCPEISLQGGWRSGGLTRLESRGDESEGSREGEGQQRPEAPGSGALTVR